VGGGRMQVGVWSTLSVSSTGGRVRARR
jgi:hypothetical protein